MLSPNMATKYISEHGIITSNNHSLINMTVHCMIACVLSDAKLLGKFIDDIFWITTSETYVQKTHPTGTNFSICPQWLGTNIFPSLHS